MHIARTTWKTYVLGSVAAWALLSSTGCQASDASKGAGAPVPTAPNATSAAGSPGRSSSGAPVDGETGQGGSKSTRPPAHTSPAGGDGSGTGDKSAACTDENISVTAKAEAHDSLRHLTLTATNIGDTTCTLHRYALVRFDEGSYDEVGPLESHAKAVVTLAPGGKAYAGMRLFIAGEETRAVETLTLGFQGRGSADEIGSPIDVPLPEGTPFLNVGPAPGVTFWDTDLTSVRRFTFAR
ncbi:DUF4232 domain-containing protein [Streptomyces sp. NPDC053755]|uniref:DUF4232 domain-containing protein n=1 Tax=Streptomyces sp. NPDC053755 TaxID=3155815 RepID=UPI003432FD46